MRILFILLVLFLPFSLEGKAAELNSNVENIDLNIKDHEMAITFFQFSKGEATLIQGPDNRNIIIGSGGDNRPEVDKWLSLYNVKEISTIILTKEPSLSLDKLFEFISKYNIREIVVSPEVLTVLKDSSKMDSDLTLTVWKKGDKKQLSPELKVETLFQGNQLNEGIDLALEFFNHRILLMSSYSKRSEETILTKNIADVSVVKLPKCTEEDSISEELIDLLNPEIAILSDPDRYPPAQDVLHHLQETWSEVYSMKQGIPVSIKLTEINYEVIKIPVKKD